MKNVKILSALIALFCVAASGAAQAQTHELADGSAVTAAITEPQATSFNAMRGDRDTAATLDRNTAVVPAPEPGALLLAGMGCMGFVLVRRRAAQMS